MSTAVRCRGSKCSNRIGMKSERVWRPWGRAPDVTLNQTEKTLWLVRNLQSSLPNMRFDTKPRALNMSESKAPRAVWTAAGRAHAERNQSSRGKQYSSRVPCACINNVGRKPGKNILKRTFSHITAKRRMKGQRDLPLKDTIVPSNEQSNDLDSSRSNSARRKVNRSLSIKELPRILKSAYQRFTQVGIQNHKGSSDGIESSANDIRVPLSRPAHIPPDMIPGVIGLRNHGNTCFMNAVLQCLSHTDVLAEYFVLDNYKADLGRKKNSKKYGTKGEITEQLALLLKAIWSCQYDPEMSTAFKSVVDKYGSQYRGNLQHDAQEFLLWLLDKVHEDLNLATNKKYKIIKASELTAAPPPALKYCMNCGQEDPTRTRIVRVMLLQSSRNACVAQYITFGKFISWPELVRPSGNRSRRDPAELRTLQLLVRPSGVPGAVPLEPDLSALPEAVQHVRSVSLRLGAGAPVAKAHEPVRECAVHVAAAATGQDRRERRPDGQCQGAARHTGQRHGHRRESHAPHRGPRRRFPPPLSVITENDPLYCVELPQLKEPSDQAYVLLVWINVLVKGDLRQRFGSPYTMQVSRETSYVDLQKLLLKEMHATLVDDVLTSGQEPGLFNIRVADPAATPAQDEHPCIDPGVEHPLYTEQIEQALALCADDSGPAHVKLILEWDESTKDMIIHDDSDQVEEHASVKQLKNSIESGGTVTLEECFDLYTREETLGVEDAWHCPYCNRKQEVVKKLGLWSLPDILVIHLKRFRQQSKQRATSKLTMLVDFPLYGFDMTPHLARNGVQSQSIPLPSHHTVSNGNGLGTLGWSPWKKPRARPNNLHKYDETVYDLYAICNHHGQDLQGGHYTAYCRNPYDTQWYCFDDTRVEAVNETNLVTNSAYMLFYQRQSLSSKPSTATSSAASTSSAGSGVDHWVSKMPPFHYRSNSSNNKTVPASITTQPTNEQSNNLSSNKLSKSQEALNQDKTVAEKNANNFNRGSRNYSTLQPPKRRDTLNMADEETTKTTDNDTIETNGRVEWVSNRVTSSVGLCFNNKLCSLLRTHRNGVPRLLAGGNLTISSHNTRELRLREKRRRRRRVLASGVDPCAGAVSINLVSCQTSVVVQRTVSYTHELMLFDSLQLRSKLLRARAFPCACARAQPPRTCSRLYTHGMHIAVRAYYIATFIGEDPIGTLEMRQRSGSLG
ncbi:unnamed protein product, partial [Trichogramma brassicae]